MYFNLVVLNAYYLKLTLFEIVYFAILCFCFLELHISCFENLILGTTREAVF